MNIGKLVSECSLLLRKKKYKQALLLIDEYSLPELCADKSGVFAEVLWRNSSYDRAEHVYEAILERDKNNSNAWCGLGIVIMHKYYQQLSKSVEAEGLFRKAIELDKNNAEAFYRIGLSITNQGRRDEATSYFEHAVEIDETMGKAHYELAKSYLEQQNMDDALLHLQAAAKEDPEHHLANAELKIFETTIDQKNTLLKKCRWPAKQSDLVDLRKALENHVIGDIQKYPKVLNSETKVATFGSCFAGNIAMALRKLGINAKNTTFGEVINSTYANRHYIEWVTGNIGSEKSSVINAIRDHHARDPYFPIDVAEHTKRIKNSQVIIMTVGVAPCMFDKLTGELVIPNESGFALKAQLKQCEIRTTTVEENTRNLIAIVAMIRSINPFAKIIITVSPIPLNVTFEYGSAIVADCVSKSVLRVAVDYLMRQNLSNVYYWPSFESVRWLGSYIPSLYGADDKSTVHVSEWVIDTIVSLFINAFKDDGSL